MFMFLCVQINLSSNCYRFDLIPVHSIHYSVTGSSIKCVRVWEREELVNVTIFVRKKAS